MNARTTTRIPRAIGPFNDYLVRTAAYLEAGTPETNGARLGIENQEVEYWKNLLARWSPRYFRQSQLCTIKACHLRKWHACFAL